MIQHAYVCVLAGQRNDADLDSPLRFFIAEPLYQKHESTEVIPPQLKLLSSLFASFCDNASKKMEWIVRDQYGIFRWVSISRACGLCAVFLQEGPCFLSKARYYFILHVPIDSLLNSWAMSCLSGVYWITQICAQVWWRIFVSQYPTLGGRILILGCRYMALGAQKLPDLANVFPKPRLYSARIADWRSQGKNSDS